MNLPEDFKEFIELLQKHEVEFLIVGGFAVALHGYPRYTDDLDILLKRNTKNAERVIQVLNDFGFGSLGLVEQDFLNEDMIIQLGYPPLRIDLITSISGIDNYDEIFGNAIKIESSEINLNIISLDDLIKNKDSTNRPIDKIDSSKLRKIKAKQFKEKK